MDRQMENEQTDGRKIERQIFLIILFYIYEDTQVGGYVDTQACYSESWQVGRQVYGKLEREIDRYDVDRQIDKQIGR